MWTLANIISLGPLYSRAKSRGHEIARAQKKMSKFVACLAGDYANQSLIIVDSQKFQPIDSW